MYDRFIKDALSGDADSDAAVAAVVDDVDQSPTIDLDLMASDETLECDEDARSVQSLQVSHVPHRRRRWGGRARAPPP